MGEENEWGRVNGLLALGPTGFGALGEGVGRANFGADLKGEKEERANREEGRFERELQARDDGAT